ncbi:MAG: hypothetical protein FWH15_02955 [Betaproteobacteria bacterium]|nr:hypothetical protein [Betaproteobacteria bacterium]
MNSVTGYFSQAELALAAYASLKPGVDPKPELEQVSMTKTQAAKFASEWTVVNQLPDTSSGFSGTLFRDKDGQHAFALRGTAGATDPNFKE